ncbi:MAG: hypothetical protein LBK29_02075 [Oscillospiraceae bacterium]|nr:hypothetical protein [Oscillospiraceae bacterium]
MKTLFKMTICLFLSAGIGLSNSNLSSFYSNFKKNIYSKKQNTIEKIDLDQKRFTRNSKTINNTNYDEHNSKNRYNSKINTSNYSKLSFWQKRLKTEKQFEVYSQMEEKIRKISKKCDSQGNYPIEPIIIDGKISKEEVQDAIQVFLNDHVDVFWIRPEYSSIQTSRYTELNLFSDRSLKIVEYQKKQIEDNVNKILKKIKPEMTEIEKEKTVHDSIIEKCKYNHNKNSKSIDNYSIYGCLVKDTCVCSGFSKAVKLIFNKAGIECEVVSGVAGNDDTRENYCKKNSSNYKISENLSKLNKLENHMWNITKIERKWYHLDVTWDSSNLISKYNFFNVDDKTIKQSHIPNAKIEDGKLIFYQNFLPECYSMENNYYEKFALKTWGSIGYMDEIAQHLYESALSDSSLIHIKVENEDNFDEIKHRLINGLLAEIINTINPGLRNRIKINEVKIGEFAPQSVLNIGFRQ